LQEVVADQPVIQITQDAQGRTNLPRPSGKSSGGPDLFSLGVRHAVIRDGTFRFNSHQSRLLADLRDLHLEASYNAAAHSYQGSFGYRDGNLQVRNFRPIPHALETQFRATGTGVELSPLHLTSSNNGSTRLDGSVYIADYNHPSITASYALSLDTNEVAAILRQPQVPRGRVEVKGQAHWTGAGGSDTLAGLDCSGSFRSALLQAVVNDQHLPLGELSGNFHLAGDGVSATSIRARVLGGTVTAQAAIHNLEHGAPGQATWDWRGAPLAEVVRWTAGTPAAASTSQLSGSVQAHGEARWHDGFEDLAAAGQAALDGVIAAQPAPLPLHAAAAFQFSHNQVQLQPATVVAAGTHLTATGGLATQGRGKAALAIEFTAPDLGQLETAANAIAAAAGRALPTLGLGGAASFRGTIAGSLAAPDIVGHAQATGLRVRGTEWHALATDLIISPHEFRATQGQLTAGGTEDIRFDFDAQLAHWNWQPGNPLQAKVAVKNLPLTQAGELAGAKLPLRGMLDADLNVQGSVQHPTGHGSIHISRPELVLDRLTEPLGDIQLELQSQGTNIAAKLRVALPAGAVQGEGSFDPGTRSYQAQIEAPSIDLKRLHIVAERQLPLAGVVALTAHGAGTWDNPGATVEVSSPRLLLQDQPVTAVQLQATLANHVVDAHLTSNAISTSLQGSARIALSDGYPTVATFDTGRIPVAALIAAVAPGAGVDVHGETEVHAHLDGPLSDVRQLRASITLPQLSLDYAQQVRLSAAQPIRLELANGILNLSSVQLEGTGTQLQASGAIPLTGAPMHLTARGTVDLKIVQAFAPTLATGGELQLDLQAAGALPRPEVSGTIGVVNASLASTSLPVAVQNGTGSLRLNGDRIAISNFHANIGGGNLTASGALTFRPRVQFDLGVQTEQIRLQLPQTVRETVGGNLSLTGTPESALLQGRFRVESVTVTPQFDLTKFISELTSSSAVVATPGSFLQNLNLNVAVSTPNQIRIVSRDFSTQAGANLTVRGTAAEPVILGRVNITSGDLIFRGSRYVLQSGALDFVNPNQTVPIVNIT
ncbi:MAG: translocation/assembly module TamB domain-containing protein, partial [Terriglobales bacterium]